MRIAAIDIGSNAARLLINEVSTEKKVKTEFIKLNFLRIPLRLGMDVFENGQIGNERKEMLINSMKIFADLMKIYKVTHYRACATSAMRDANNGIEIKNLIKETSGINIEIISGNEEANLIYENHIEQNLSSDADYLYIDVGGGSTELTFYEDGKMAFEQSFNIGTIRLLNNKVSEQDWDELRQAIKQHINTKKELLAIGSGGNINKIFSMSNNKDSKPLSNKQIKDYYKEIAPLSVAERISKYGFKEDRADVIVPALEIFDNVLQWAKINKIFVPKISLADGLIHHIYENVKDGNKMYEFNLI